MRLQFIRYPEKKITPHPPPPTFKAEPNFRVIPRPPNGSDFYVQVGGPNGLGTCLLYKLMFEYLIEHDIVGNIYYTFPQHVFRPDYPPQYHDDMFELLKIILPSRCHYVAEDPRCAPLSWEHIVAIFEIPSQRFPLRNNFPRYDSPPISVPYIALNMKVSNISKQILELTISNLINVLNESPYPIILLGERATTPCLEYQLLPDHLSIYQDVYPKLRRVIDMTYDETCNANSLDNIRKSATVYTYSKYNIIMNSSGGLGFLAHFGRIIGLVREASTWEVLMDMKDSCLTNNGFQFIQLVRERIVP